jgi:hypothetical protein
LEAGGGRLFHQAIQDGENQGQRYRVHDEQQGNQPQFLEKAIMGLAGDNPP